MTDLDREFRRIKSGARLRFETLANVYARLFPGGVLFAAAFDVVTILAGTGILTAWSSLFATVVGWVLILAGFAGLVDKTIRWKWSG